MKIKPGTMLEWDTLHPSYPDYTSFSVAKSRDQVDSTGITADDSKYDNWCTYLQHRERFMVVEVVEVEPGKPSLGVLANIVGPNCGGWIRIKPHWNLFKQINEP